MRFSRITSHDELQALQGDWDALYDRAENGQVFLSSAWLLTWCEVFKRHIKDLSVYCVWDQHKLVALLPLYCPEANPRHLYFLGTGEPEKSEVCSEYLDILLDGAYETEAKRTLLTVIDAFSKTLFIPNIRQNAQLKRWLEEAVPKALFRQQSHLRRYFIPLHNPPLAKSKLRKKATRYYNTFLKQNGASVVRPKNLPEAVAMFQTMVTLHRRRWQKKQTQTIFDDPDFMAFHQYLIPRMWENGRLALTQLAVSDDVIAVFYGFTNDKSMFFYQNGINEEFKPNVSAGSIMHLVQAQFALSEGLDEYDFLGSKPGNTYKTRLTTREEPLFKITVYPSIVRKYREMLMVLIQKVIGRFYRNRK